MARSSTEMEDVPSADVVDLRAIIEEMNPAERVEYEQKLHAMQPSPANKLVFFRIWCLVCLITERT